MNVPINLGRYVVQVSNCCECSDHWTTIFCTDELDVATGFVAAVEEMNPGCDQILSVIDTQDNESEENPESALTPE